MVHGIPSSSGEFEVEHDFGEVVQEEILLQAQKTAQAKGRQGLDFLATEDLTRAWEKTKKPPIPRTDSHGLPKSCLERGLGRRSLNNS